MAHQTRQAPRPVSLLPLFGVPAVFAAAFAMSYFPFVYRMPLCGFKYLTGLDCPGCGLTRSFALLAHGRLMASMNMHPMGIIIAAWLLYMMGRSAVSFVRRKPLPELLTQRGRDWILAAFVAGLMLQWVVKLAIS